MTTPNTEGAALTDSELTKIIWRLAPSAQAEAALIRHVGQYEIAEPTYLLRRLADFITEAVRAQGAAEKESTDALIQALRLSWAGFVNLSADMEPGPLRQQMRNHAARIDAALSAHSAEPPADALGHQVERCGEAVRRQDGYTEPTQSQIVAPSRATGFAAKRDHYAMPVLFNPYTGEPRDVRDVQSDPQGILIVPPGALLIAAKPAEPERPAPSTDARLAEAEETIRNLMRALREATEAPTFEPPGPRTLTEEQVERHSLMASECPPGIQVLPAYSVRRLLGLAASAPVVDNGASSDSADLGVTLRGGDEPPHGFLAQIDKAKADFAAWPQWMKDAARVATASLPNTAAAPLPAKTPETDKTTGIRIGEGEQT